MRLGLGSLRVWVRVRVRVGVRIGVRVGARARVMGGQHAPLPVAAPPLSPAALWAGYPRLGARWVGGRGTAERARAPKRRPGAWTQL